MPHSTISPLAAASPAPGVWVPLTEGIHWAQIPLPFRLDHVNVWLVDDVDGWALIDCGIDSADVRAIWNMLLGDLPGGRPISRIIATHGHTDHIGCAGYLAGKLRVPFQATLVEWLMARMRRVGVHLEATSAESHFYAMHGCPSVIIGEMQREAGATGQYLGPLPDQLLALRPGEILRIGKRDFEILGYGGHADGHVSFYCAADRILLAGDQVLMTISPVIAVFEDQPEADPLGDYIESLSALLALPDSTMVLPGHGLPFRGLRPRLAALKAHHDERLTSLEAMIAAPTSAYAAAERLFQRAFQSGHRRLAFAETLAHLHRLKRERRATQTSDGGAVLWAKC